MLHSVPYQNSLAPANISLASRKQWRNPLTAEPHSTKTPKHQRTRSLELRSSGAPPPPCCTTAVPSGETSAAAAAAARHSHATSPRHRTEELLPLLYCTLLYCNALYCILLYSTLFYFTLLIKLLTALFYIVFYYTT